MTNYNFNVVKDIKNMKNIVGVNNLSSEINNLVSQSQLTPILFDILLNYVIIFISLALCIVWDNLYVHFASIIIFGNRQRALGNILHDGGHGSLSKSRKVNDIICKLLVAPALFNEISYYRRNHLLHHANLGSAEADPDYIHDNKCSYQSIRWPLILSKYIFNIKSISESLFGHLFKIPLSEILYILSWWSLVLLIIYCIIGYKVLAFISIWILAKLTSFHIITTIREVADHVGLHPGGILSFTRNITGSYLLSKLIHPHNNGYHLLHHLYPNLSYRNLLKAHNLLMYIDEYKNLNNCDGYFTGNYSMISSISGGVRR
jgi:fatty acid desaturase